MLDGGKWSAGDARQDLYGLTLSMAELIEMIMEQGNI